jgi:hypothetical protein
LRHNHPAVSENDYDTIVVIMESERVSISDAIKKLDERRAYNRRSAARARQRIKDQVFDLSRQVDVKTRENQLLLHELEKMKHENRTLYEENLSLKSSSASSALPSLHRATNVHTNCQLPVTRLNGNALCGDKTQELASLLSASIAPGLSLHQAMLLNHLREAQAPQNADVWKSGSMTDSSNALLHEISQSCRYGKEKCFSDVQPKTALPRYTSPSNLISSQVLLNDISSLVAASQLQERLKYEKAGLATSIFPFAAAASGIGNHLHLPSSVVLPTARSTNNLPTPIPHEYPDVLRTISFHNADQVQDKQV